MTNAHIFLTISADIRQQIHKQFILPTDRPLVRRTNAYRFPNDQRGDVYLTNTHVGLSPSGGKVVFEIKGIKD